MANLSSLIAKMIEKEKSSTTSGVIDVSSGSAVSYIDLFVEELNRRNVGFSHDENVISVVMRCENCRCKIFFKFDKDNDNDVHISTYNFASPCRTDERMAAAMAKCNEFNGKYRWVGFYVDDDGDVTAEMDAILDPNSCGEECYELMERLTSILDDVVQELNIAIWKADE